MKPEETVKILDKILIALKKDVIGETELSYVGQGIEDGRWYLLKNGCTVKVEIVDLDGEEHDSLWDTACYYVDFGDGFHAHVCRALDNKDAIEKAQKMLGTKRKASYVNEGVDCDES